MIKYFKKLLLLLIPPQKSFFWSYFSFGMEVNLATSNVNNFKGSSYTQKQASEE